MIAGADRAPDEEHLGLGVFVRIDEAEDGGDGGLLGPWIMDALGLAVAKDGAQRVEVSPAHPIEIPERASQRDGDLEPAAGAVARADGPAVELDDLLGDHQAEPEALGPAAGRHPVEGLEQSTE